MKYVWGKASRDTSPIIVNDYMVHTDSKYAGIDGYNRTCRPGLDKVAQCG